MATLTNINNKIEKLANNFRIYAQMTNDSLRGLYETVSPRWFCVVREWNEETGDIETRRRPWGEGNNEFFEPFKAQASKFFFGHEEWHSDEASIETVVIMERCKLREHQIHMVDLLTEEQWNDFNRVKQDRSEASEYYFDDLEFYVKGVDHFGSKAMGQTAKWWNSLKFHAERYGIENAMRAVRYEAALGRQKVGAYLDIFATGNLIQKVIKNFRGSIATMHMIQNLKIPIEPYGLILTEQEERDLLKIHKANFTLGDPTIMKPEHIAKLILGKTPSEISNGFLNNKEATEWLRSGDAYAQNWLIKKLGMDDNNDVWHLSAIRAGRLVFDWAVLKLKKARTAMYKDRVIHGPNGYIREFKYIELLDEIQEADLVNGVNTSPDVAFEASARRLHDLYMTQIGENVKLPICPVKTLPGIKQIVDSVDLIEEGRKYGHCVGGYIHACIRAESFIFTADKGGNHATIEVNPRVKGGYLIRQIKGRNNSRPSQDVLDLVLQWAEKTNMEVMEKF